MEPHTHSVSVVIDRQKDEIDNRLREEVNDDPNITVLNRSSEPADLLDYVRTVVPDVVLLNMQHQDNDIIEDIHEATPRTQVVAVVEPERSDMAGDALLAGAIGYMYETSGPNGEASETIHSAVQQRGALDPDVANHIWKNGMPRIRRLWHLTPWEKRLLQRIRKGQNHTDTNILQEEWERSIAHIILKYHQYRKIHRRRNHIKPIRTLPSSSSILQLVAFIWLGYCLLSLPYTLPHMIMYIW